MVDPATQLDQGGNPLQEGVWANIDGGWQPEYRRDEFFAKTADRGPFDMRGDSYPLPSGELGQHYNCPNCGGQMGEDGECYRCGYAYGGDEARAQQGLVDEFREFPFTMDDSMNSVPRDLGTARQGSIKLPPSGIEPQYHGTAQPVEPAGVHNGNLHWLHFLDASINGKPVREHREELYNEHGYRNLWDPATRSYSAPNPSWLAPVTVSVHHPEHLEAAIEAIQTPQLSPSKETLRYAPKLAATGKAIFQGSIPPPPGINVPSQPQPQTPPQVMSHYDRALSMEPYLPWYHKADFTRYPANGGEPYSMTHEEWAADKKQRYQDRQLVQGGHRLEWQPGQAGRGIMIGNQLHTWPVEKTLDNPQGGLMHGEYVRQLGVNPAHVDVTTGFEIDPDGTMMGRNIDPRAAQIDPFLRAQTGDPFAQAFGSTKTSIAPLLAVGGRLLLSQAIGGLMRKAIGGAGNFLNQGAPMPEDPYGGARPVGLVASEHTAVGVGAPVETPGSVPDMVEDHDPEAVDQQEYNDGDMSPAFNNPNIDGDEAGLSQSTGEDATKQKLEFRHDGDAVGQAELLLPLILEYLNSEKSALENPQLRALHEALDAEIPGYLDHTDDEEVIQKFLDELKKPHESKTDLRTPGAQIHPQAKTAAPVYQGTPIPMAQQQMGFGQGQQMAMPGTHANPVQPGGMPVSGRCMNCGGVVNADGSCPQCGAAAGANQMGNLQQPGGQQTPIGIMPSPYSHTAADHQGPITPQQKEVFAQYLIDQGRNDEVAAMMANPAMYADEWAQYINKSTQPPEVDPAEQAPMPQVDPSQMGQMPVPPMSIPQPTGSRRKADSAAPRCPKCDSATTSVMSGDGDCRCARCGNVWTVDNFVKDKPDSIVSNWRIVAYPDALNNDSPNPVAAPAADATAPGDREQQQDSTLSWQSSDGTPLQVGQVYEMHNPGYAIPDIIKIEQVKPDSIVVTMEGEYNAPSDPQDANGPGYTHEITLQEAQAEGLTFNPASSGEGEQEQSQDNAAQDGIGQTVNTEPVEQPHDEFPVHSNFTRMAPMSEYDQYFGGESGAAAKAKAAMIEQYGQKKGEEVFYATVNKKKGGSMDPLFKRIGLPYCDICGEPHATELHDEIQIEKQHRHPGTGYEADPAAAAAANVPTIVASTDQCPKCEYGHVTSSYLSPELIQYECFRCAHQWKISDVDEGTDLAPESREWLRGSDDEEGEVLFDPRALAMASAGQGRNIRDIARRDPRHAEIRDRLNKNAGAKFSPREQKGFIDEEGVARNADRLNLDGTHYIESAFDNTKARPDRVNDNYLGLGL